MPGHSVNGTVKDTKVSTGAAKTPWCAVLNDGEPVNQNGPPAELHLPLKSPCRCANHIRRSCRYLRCGQPTFAPQTRYRKKPPCPMFVVTSSSILCRRVWRSERTICRVRPVQPRPSVSPGRGQSSRRPGRTADGSRCVRPLYPRGHAAAHPGRTVEEHRYRGARAGWYLVICVPSLLNRLRLSGHRCLRLRRPRSSRSARGRLVDLMSKYLLSSNGGRLVS